MLKTLLPVIIIKFNFLINKILGLNHSSHPGRLQPAVISILKPEKRSFQDEKATEQYYFFITEKHCLIHFTPLSILCNRTISFIKSKSVFVKTYQLLRIVEFTTSVISE
ncbi:hypothetical protein CEXT_134341 [Caerostris extrusa]|uniref:Uncharacterized protein n=1 Tax=Caerostris extrusa TaxID=172846 RepID=A0AAV4XHA3_CAEEX|nr:hypothetical protein CEXT_134341 [Caerostris extrusa]